LNGHVPEISYVALGSNLGDRAGYLASARAALSLLPATELIAASCVEETIPMGAQVQGPYLNQMVALRTDLQAEALLDGLHAIERSLGRTRATRWGPRTIDLDIVRFGELRVDSERLTVPHPGLADRAFWQREVSELDALVEHL
jgi:2-amino-4-hydroxy-6-hydroxymethyldihydropteridine diphosphokinase